MRKVIVGLVLVSIAYFIFGFFATKIGVLPIETYLNLSAIVGSVASVSGLLSFGIAKKISAEDFENVELGYLQKVSEAAEQLKQKREEIQSKSQALSETEKELKKL
jgi:hypothetical protein